MKTTDLGAKVIRGSDTEWDEASVEVRVCG